MIVNEPTCKDTMIQSPIEPVADRGSASCSRPWLFGSVGSVYFSFSIADIIAVFRPAPIRSIPGPPALLGISVARGKSVPVLDLATLLGVTEASVHRFLLVRVGDRQVILAVDKIEGIMRLDVQQISRLPPLLKHLDRIGISEIVTLDGELVTLLEASRLIPNNFWSQLGANGLSDDPPL